MGDVVGNSANGVVIFNKEVADALFSIAAVVDVVNRCADVNADDTGTDGIISDGLANDQCIRNGSDFDIVAREEDRNGNDVTDAEANGDDDADGGNAVDDQAVAVAVAVALGSIVAAVCVVNAFEKDIDGDDDDDDDDDDNISVAGVRDDGNKDEGDSVDRAFFPSLDSLI